jgi:hypothetical protein
MLAFSSSSGPPIKFGQPGASDLAGKNRKHRFMTALRMTREKYAHLSAVGFSTASWSSANATTGLLSQNQQSLFRRIDHYISRLLSCCGALGKGKAIDKM